MRKPAMAVVAALLALGVPASAAAQEDVIGHVGYNTYSMDWGGGADFFNSGLGGFAAVRYWITETLAVGVGVDYLTGSGSDKGAVVIGWIDLDGDGYGDIPVTEIATFEAQFSSLGLLGVVFADMPMGENLVVQPFVGIGSYGARAEITGESVGVEVSVPFEADRRIGFLGGVHVGMPVTASIRLGGTVGYRGVDFPTGTMTDPLTGMKVEVEDSAINASGFFAGASLSIAF